MTAASCFTAMVSLKSDVYIDGTVGGYIGIFAP
jgi:hypothetical protein